MHFFPTPKIYLESERYIIVTILNSLPMTKNSNSSLSQMDSESDINMHKPRKSSVNFLRQFARAYTVIAGVGLNQLIAN